MPRLRRGSLVSVVAVVFATIGVPEARDFLCARQRFASRTGLPVEHHRYRHQLRRIGCRATGEERTKDIIAKTGADVERLPTSNEKYQVGQTVEGTVDRIFYPAGIFVDIGCERNGLLEWGELKDGYPTKDASFDEGRRIEARILSNDGEAIFLTKRSGELERPPKPAKGSDNTDFKPFEDVASQEWLDAKLGNMKINGAFVYVEPPGGGSPATGYIRAQDLTNEFKAKAIRGMDLKVRVQKANAAEGQLWVTMKES